jgi:rod shape-determining protein MreD
MRFFRLLLYVLGVLVLQTVVFSRLSFMGVTPDLILVSVVAFAVLEERTPATFFSAALGFIQDLFSSGIYLNVIIKTIVSNVISSVKEGFMGDEYGFTAGMVAVFTPLCLLLEGLALSLVFHKQFDLAFIIFKMAAATIYNLVLVPVLFPAVKWATHAD